MKALLQNKEIAHGKVTVANESLEKEIAKLKESAKKHKEELEAYETKAKWSQNKLKAELESHKVLFVTFRKWKSESFLLIFYCYSFFQHN